MIPLHDDHPTLRFPILTVLIIAVNIGVFAFVQPHGTEEIRFLYEHSAIPCELVQNEPLSRAEIFTGECVRDSGPPVFPEKQVWLAVIVAMFLHAGWLHLIGNMWFLWIFGDNVEEYATKLGFLAVYLVSGIAAMGAQVLVDPHSTAPVLGASGAIAGVMGMYFVLWPRARILTVIPVFLFAVVRIPAAWVLIAWFVLQFLTGPDSGVAWGAHVGGFVAGAAMALALRTVRPPRGPYEGIARPWRPWT